MANAPIEATVENVLGSEAWTGNDGPMVTDGLCECGCGGKTKIATKSDRYKGHVKGEPMRFLPRHHARVPRGHRRLTPTHYTVSIGGCWMWNGYITPLGYGRLADVRAHRLMYEQRVGPVDPGDDLHHLCCNRACVNPEHLQVLSRGEHSRLTRLAQPARAACDRGHVYTPETTYRHNGRRKCRVCHREYEAQRRTERQAA